MEKAPRGPIPTPLLANQYDPQSQLKIKTEESCIKHHINFPTSHPQLFLIPFINTSVSYGFSSSSSLSSSFSQWGVFWECWLLHSLFWDKNDICSWGGYDVLVFQLFAGWDLYQGCAWYSSNNVQTFVSLPLWINHWLINQLKAEFVCDFCYQYFSMHHICLATKVQSEWRLRDGLWLFYWVWVYWS